MNRRDALVRDINATIEILWKQMALTAQLLLQQIGSQPTRNRPASGSRISGLGAISFSSFVRPSGFCRFSFVLLAVSILLCGCEAESAKWDLAKAKNLYNQGNLSGAIELLEAAHQKAPEDDGIKLELAMRYAENGQCELGIGLCNDYLKQHPDDVNGFALRADCYRFLGKFDKALADHKRSLSDHVSRDPGELNDLAYYRGLADKEIDKAVVEIQTAIGQIEMATRGKGVGIPLAVRTLVATGIVSRSIDQHQEALSHLDKKIQEYQTKVPLTNEVLKTRVTGLIRYHDKLRSDDEKALLKLRVNLQRQKESLTALLATRALVLEDLEEHKKADSDRLAIQELDFDFDEVVNGFPTDLQCLGVLRIASAYLDTRGFILGRQKWTTNVELESLIGAPASSQLHFSNYEEALSDLDLAVLAAQFEQLSLESSLCNSTSSIWLLPPEILPHGRKGQYQVNFSVDQIQQWKKANKRNLAVLLHHRKEIHLRSGNKAAAALDQQSIDELGFNDSSLF